MSSYSKMVVLPQEEYVQLASVHKAQQPIVQQFNELTRENMKLNHIDDPYRRLQLQGSNLEERKVLKDKMRRFITLSTPRQYRSRAETLFDFVEPHMRFNEKGEIIDGQTGQVIENSHIDDLLQHAVRDMRRNLGKPIGWDYFLKMLRHENVPHNIVGSPTVLELSKAQSKGNLSFNLFKKMQAKGKKVKRTREVEAEADDKVMKKRRSRIPPNYYKY